MLKRLFTSNARIKLLKVFLLNPESQFFIRELTRKLDEQINSIRRELTNLKKAGLLKSKNVNRKKYYVVNKNFILYNELRNIIMKASGDADDIGKKILKLGKMDVLVLSGVFVNKQSPADLLLVGKVDKDTLEEFLQAEIKPENPLKFSIMTREDFVYRMRMHDKFVGEMLENPDNIVVVNKLGNPK